MTMPTFDEIREQHQVLLELQDKASTEELIAEARQLLEQIAKAGGATSDTRKRSQLRALMRYWSSFIYDRTGDFTNLDLLPSSLDQSRSLSALGEKLVEVGDETHAPSRHADQTPSTTTTWPPSDNAIVLPDASGGNLPNSAVGPYQILERIGEGGLSEVFRAYDAVQERMVALKILQSKRFVNHRFVQHLLDHERIASGLEHQNIVPVYDIGEYTGTAYVAMMLVEGGSLADRLTTWFWRPTLRQVLNILRQVAEGLGYLHSRQLVHRDLKPANVLLGFDDHVYLTDFGITGVMEDAYRGMIVGTPEYMAPEAILSPNSIDGRADLYSLGVMMFELLTGKRPFTAESTEQLLHLQVQEEPPDIDQLTEMPEGVTSLVQKCLSKDRDKRYSGAAELAVEIDSLLGSLPEEVLSARLTHFISAPEARENAPTTAPFLPRRIPRDQRTVPASEVIAGTMDIRPSTSHTSAPTRLLTDLESSPVEPKEAWLVVTTSVQQGARFRLKDQTRLGRDPNLSDIVFEDDSVSRLHARIVREASGFRVYDEGSTNGSYINSQRVSISEEAALSNEDILRVGETCLRFEYGLRSERKSPDQQHTHGALAILVGLGHHHRDYYIVQSLRATIGGSSECDIVMQYRDIARQHALLVCSQQKGKRDTFMLYDLATDAGTKINGESIVRKLIKHNDVVTFGETEFVFKRLDQ